MSIRLYKPSDDDIAKIEKLAAIGLNKAEIAASIGHTREWWYDQVDAGNQSLTLAYARGKAKHAKSIMGTLTDIALKDRNVAALTFLARCNLKRREKAPVKVDARSVTVNQPQLPQTKEERLKALKAMTAEIQNLIEADSDE